MRMLKYLSLFIHNLQYPSMNISFYKRRRIMAVNFDLPIRRWSCNESDKPYFQCFKSQVSKKQKNLQEMIQTSISWKKHEVTRPKKQILKEQMNRPFSMKVSETQSIKIQSTQRTEVLLQSLPSPAYTCMSSNFPLFHKINKEDIDYKQFRNSKMAKLMKTQNFKKKREVCATENKQNDQRELHRKYIIIEGKSKAKSVSNAENAKFLQKNQKYQLKKKGREHQCALYAKKCIRDKLTLPTFPSLKLDSRKQHQNIYPILQIKPSNLILRNLKIKTQQLQSSEGQSDLYTLNQSEKQEFQRYDEYKMSESAKDNETIHVRPSTIQSSSNHFRLLSEINASSLRVFPVQNCRKNSDHAQLRDKFWRNMHNGLKRKLKLVLS